MTQPVMDEYRARKLEDEFFERSSFKRPCELLLKHGRARMSYWGVPEVIATTAKEVRGHKMTLTSVLWKTKRDMPAMFSLLLPEGMRLENVMTPCKYMETDRGYSNVISLVIGGLIALNLLNFYLFVTMADVGTEAFGSPIFIGPFCLIMGSILAAMRFNQTHFTHRLSVECYEADFEFGKCHLCYAVDCDVPVHRQLMFENIPDVTREIAKAQTEALNETYWEIRQQIGQKDLYVTNILKDRKHQEVLSQDRASLMHAKASVWDSPVVLVLIVAVVLLAGAFVYFFATGGA